MPQLAHFQWEKQLLFSTDPHQLTFYLAYILTLFFSDILSGMLLYLPFYSDIFPGILSGIYSDLFFVTFFLAFYLPFYSDIFPGILFGIYSGIFVGIYFDILSSGPGIAHSICSCRYGVLESRDLHLAGGQ